MSSLPGADRIHLRDGRWLAYSEYGDPYGLPVFYFHSALSSRVEISFGADLCRQMGVRLLSLDRPGIGASDPQSKRTLLSWPDDVAQLADTLGIPRFAILGWAAGGPYAIACAYRLGRRVGRVAVVGGLAPFESPATVAELGTRADRTLFRLASENPPRAEHLLKLAKRLPSWMLRAIRLRDLRGHEDRRIVESLPEHEVVDGFHEAVRAGVVGVVDDYRLLASDWQVDFSRINAEVNLWHGEQDNVVPSAHAQRLSAQLPNARLILLPDRGHFLLRGGLEHVLSSLRFR